MVTQKESNLDPAAYVETLQERIELALRERRIDDADRYMSQLNEFVSFYIPEDIILPPVKVKRILNPQPNWERFAIFILTFIAGLELGIVIRPILVKMLN